LNSTRTSAQALRAPARVEHHAQHAVDTEPGMPEAGVVHAVTVPSARARWWRRESSMVIRFAIQRRLQVVYRDTKYFAELPPV
jgi:hypothetical protein